MKNITSILQKGNIKPGDRVKLLVADLVSRERDGKPLLTEADKHALSEGWTPKNNNEVREYNRYNEGWKNTAYAEMDAQTTYLQATNGLLRASKAIDYTLYDRYVNDDKTTLRPYSEGARDLFLKEFSQDEILNIVFKYVNFELDYLIYSYAFELAGEELQKDLLALYPDAKTEPDYLNQEEIIFNLFEGKDRLTQGAKEKLADLIAGACFNENLENWNFNNYFADIPLLEIAKKTADNNQISYDDKSEGLSNDLSDKLKDYADKNNTTVRELLRETILWGLNDETEGLLQAWTPLFLSDSKETCNDQDTKLTHKEVFKKWLEAKTKAKDIIQGLIDRGELTTEKKTIRDRRLKTLLKKLMPFYNEPGKTRQDRQDKTGQTGQTGQDTIITTTEIIVTGKSLYNLKGDYQFIKDFRQQAESFKIFGALNLYLKKCYFVNEYSTLLAFELLFKELSKTFETDLTYNIKKWLELFNDDLEMLKRELLHLNSRIIGNDCQIDRIFYLAENYLEELLDVTFDPDKVKAKMDGRVKTYASKIKELLQDNFNNPFE